MASKSQVNEPDVFEPSLTQGYSDLLRIAWRGKWLIVLGIVVGLVLGFVYYCSSTPVYKAAAQVLVIKKRPSTLPNTGVDLSQAYADDYFSAQQALIQSPLIIDRAIQRGKLQTLASLAGVRNPRDVIVGGLSVGHDAKDSSDRTNVILDLTYRSTVAEDCATVLNAVIDSYQEFLDEVHRKDSDKVRQLFTQWKNEVQKQLTEKQAAYQKLREATSLTAKGTDEVKLSGDRLDRLESEKFGCIFRQTEIREQLAAIEAAQKGALSHEALLELISKWSSKTGSGSTVISASATSASALQDQLFQMLLQEQTLLKDLGPEHAEIVALRKRIQLTRDWITSQSSTNDGPRRPDPVDAYSQYLQQDLRVNAGMEQALAKLLDTERAKAKKANDQMEDIEALRNDIASIQELYKGITKHLEDLSLTKDSGGYDAQVISPPGNGAKMGPSRTVILALAVLAGLLVGIGLVSVVEISDKSFRTPDEIRSRLGAPVVGHIPLLQPGHTLPEEIGVSSEGRVLEPILCTHYWPQSMEAEAYRALRTALHFSLGRAGHKVIQITSPSVGDGKTTLAANLAVSLAQSGKRVVLVDADLRRPRLHEIFGLSPEIGLTSAIVGEAEPEDVVQPTPIAGLWVLPCGPLPPSPADILVLARFKELLDYLRDHYDWVLVDSSALLTVTDPSVVAGRVDGVLLSLRIAKDNRPRADRAKEILDTLATPVLGVVVNAVEPRAGSDDYHYECTRYGAEYFDWISRRARQLSLGGSAGPVDPAPAPEPTPAPTRNGTHGGQKIPGPHRAGETDHNGSSR